MADKPVVAAPNVRVEDFESFYSKSVQFDMTGWDISMLFGDIVKEETSEEVRVQASQHTEVRLSWPQAKVAALLFVVNIAAQEEKDGPIRVPPDVIPYLVDNAERGLSIVEMAKLIMQRADASKNQTAPAPPQST